MNRRSFCQSLFTGGCVLPLTPGLLRPAAAWAATAPVALSAVTRTLDIDGRAATVLGLVQLDGTPGLSLRAGETVEVALSNTLPEGTMIHWHGLTPPWAADGVPDAPLPLLGASETRSYVLPAGLSGTRWMHAHTLQEQRLLAAPLIVRGPEDLARDEQEVVVMLHDFCFRSPEELLADLRQSVGTAGMDMPGMTMGGMDHMAHGAMAGMSMPGIGAMDLNDIAYDAFLANDRTLNDPEVVRVDRGSVVRLRIINGATATAFTIDTGALAAEVIAVNGQDVKPFAVSAVPLAMGQRVDLRLHVPPEGGAFPILALREGAPERAGIILATPGATIARLPVAGDAPGPVLALDTEARLVSLRPLSGRPADRSFSVDLTGTMQGYQWAMTPSAPLEIVEGERVEITMHNTSMMAHPMHLHGHHFQVVGIDAQPLRGALRDTVLVPPMRSVTVAFDAINPGAAWAFHCHHLYHMAAGMMAHLAYREA